MYVVIISCKHLDCSIYSLCLPVVHHLIACFASSMLCTNHAVHQRLHASALLLPVVTTGVSVLLTVAIAAEPVLADCLIGL